MGVSVHSQPHNRVFNFSAGPCTLPVPVLEEAQRDLLNWHGCGASVMELSHRGKDFESIHATTQADLRALLNLPENYKILFLQGGASLQFTMIPMNFRRAGTPADYVVTGTWGSKAVEAAKLDGATNVLYSAKSSNFDHTPRLSEMTPSDGSSFVHFTSNETIQGVDFMADPDTPGDWICDMSSNILSRRFDPTKYALIYAGAQKNMGPAGVTLAIVREDLFERIPTGLAPMLDYNIHADNDSMYNTPPCWSIYMCGLVYKWILGLGGLEAMEKLTEAKAAVLYDAIDASEFYKGHAVKANRSRMNVTFTLPTDELTSSFISGAKAEGMIELKGHRSVGGCRASIYNAFPLEGCQALAEYMREFERTHG